MSRLLVLLLLLFATALSGGADAAVRAVGSAAQVVVVCADGHAVTVTLGADGLPVEPRDNSRHCPDCLPLATGAAGAAPPVAAMRPAAGRARPAALAAFPSRAPGHAALPSPRGPPDGVTA